MMRRPTTEEITAATREIAGSIPVIDHVPAVYLLEFARRLVAQFIELEGPPHYGNSASNTAKDR